MGVSIDVLDRIVLKGENGKNYTVHERICVSSGASVRILLLLFCFYPPVDGTNYRNIRSMFILKNKQRLYYRLE